jgi:hypothetical protein
MGSPRPHGITISSLQHSLLLIWCGTHKAAGLQAVHGSRCLEHVMEVYAVGGSRGAGRVVQEVVQSSSEMRLWHNRPELQVRAVSGSGASELHHSSVRCMRRWLGGYLHVV